MAGRVRDFLRSNPSSEPAHLEALTKLEERLARADVLTRQLEAGMIAQRAATQRRQELRREMTSQLLPHLIKVGQEVGEAREDLSGRFRSISPNAPLRSFIDSSKRMFDLAGTERALFLANGLVGSLFDDLGQSIADFEQATVDSHRGKQDHVGAVADLGGLAREVVKLVAKLDGLNRYRFRKDRELKAAWDSARDVVGPFRANGKNGAGETPSATGAPPAP